jgi:hypothetical protein
VELDAVRIDRGRGACMHDRTIIHAGAPGVAPVRR